MNKLIMLYITLAMTSTECKKSDQEQPLDQGQSLNTINFMEAYTIDEPTFGTKTTVTLEGDQRIMETNGLPNHETGTFPNAGNPNSISAQSAQYSFPLNPTFIGTATWAREPGVAVNGIKFEPETAENFTCETGERYKIEAFQNLINLGLDSNHAHVQPSGAYHYHGVPVDLIDLLDKGEDRILIGFAHDGFPIYYSKSNAYKSSYRLKQQSRTGDVCSYSNPNQTINKNLENTQPDGTFVSDWEYVDGLGDLDECNGIKIDSKYVYFVTDDYPYVGRCLMGEFPQQSTSPPPRNRQATHTHPHRH